ncbi:C40 family peptidase [Deminuibacter soli]|nr:C40 family peptidase [Deminuibacter soli]
MRKQCWLAALFIFHLAGAGAQSVKDSVPAPIAGGVVTLSVCNNRLTPDQRAEMVTQTLLGTPVQILRKDKGYYQVRTPDGYVSYTEMSGVQLLDTTALKAWLHADKIVYTAGYGYVLDAPNKHGAQVSDLVAGDILRVLRKKRRYYQVQFPDNRTGYVPVKETMPYTQWVARKNPDAAAILATAQRFTGVPYLWGGTSVKGVDCSGFTKSCYYLNGIVLPRDASQQALVGEPVDITEHDTISNSKCLRNLQAGDLLFFAVKKGTPQQHVIHTAIYMGGGRFIQAAGMVRVNSIVPGAPDFDAREYERLVSARRMLTAIGTNAVTRVEAHPYYQ